jgi:hypothetical protein
VAQKSDLKAWVVEALHAQGGRAHLIDVAKYIWNEYKEELERSGDLFYTWQYDMRWAATALRKRGVMKPSVMSPSGKWELTRTSRDES